MRFLNIIIKLYRQGIVLYRNKKINPQAASHSGNPKWELDWNSRPPAQISVLYKSPSMRPPQDIYGKACINVSHKTMQTKPSLSTHIE